MDRRASLRGGLALMGSLSALSAGRTARAQAQPAPFPSRPLRIVVPFAAGGPTDTMARALGQKVGEALGQSVVVDNRPGGGSQIGAAAAKQSPADGHTLFIGDIGALAINVSLYQNLSYDPVKDFQPVTLLMSAPMVLMVPAASPARSFAELVALSRAKGQITMASQGIGTGGHLMSEVMKASANASIAHIPYKGSAPAIQDLISGQVDALFDLLPVALPQAGAGKVRVLAVCSAARSALLPDVPTTAELGFPDVRMDAWFAMVTLAGTPDAAVRRLNAEVSTAIRNPEVNKRFVDQGFVVDPGPPEALAALMRSEIDRWGVVVRRSGARAD
jgi:tripartite-type tricarboxylate transporter receptor subunit TctC